MKVILSRKGFDSGAGGYPSPILPVGDLLSLPIPSDADLVKYSEIMCNENDSFYDIMSQLIKGDLKSGSNKILLNPDTTCHLDPDLKSGVMKRTFGWKPLYGQRGSSQSHLDNNQINIRDVFLFFG